MDLGCRVQLAKLVKLGKLGLSGVCCPSVAQPRCFRVDSALNLLLSLLPYLMTTSELNGLLSSRVMDVLHQFWRQLVLQPKESKW